MKPDPKRVPYVEPMLEIVPTEREERERSPRKPHDEYWVWNADPSKVPAKKPCAN